MDKSVEKFEDIEEAIQLASQEDLVAIKEDENLSKLEELISHLQLQQRLMLEADVRQEKITIVKENDNVNDPQELTKKILETTVKSEEDLQLNVLCQKAIETCQYSLALESAENVEPAEEKTEEELARLSIEYINLCMKNMSDLQEIESLDNELQRVQKHIAELQVENSRLKSNPKTNAGATSERIEKLETQLDKFCGRYDFTRFLTQLLLVASEKDLNDPKRADLFIKCGEAV